MKDHRLWGFKALCGIEPLHRLFGHLTTYDGGVTCKTCKRGIKAMRKPKRTRKPAPSGDSRD